MGFFSGKNLPIKNCLRLVDLSQTVFIMTVEGLFRCGWFWCVFVDYEARSHCKSSSNCHSYSTSDQKSQGKKIITHDISLLSPSDSKTTGLQNFQSFDLSEANNIIVMSKSQPIGFLLDNQTFVAHLCLLTSITFCLF